MTDKTTTTTIPAPLPCPFCGASDPLVTDLPPHKHAIAALPDHPGSVTVECPACAIGLIKPTRAEAVASWNRRAAPSPAPAAPSAAQGWLDPATYRKDGTLVRLLIECQPGGQDENPTTDVGDGETWETIGSNGAEHSEIDEWQFAGWDWCQDRWTEGRGKVVGWKPYHDSAPAQPAQDSLTETAKRMAWAMHLHHGHALYDDASDLWSAMSSEKKAGWLSAARAAQPVGEVAEELSRLGLCWDAEYFPALAPDEEFGIAPENHYRVTITTSLEDTAIGWGATLEEAARAALRSGEGR